MRMMRTPDLLRRWRSLLTDDSGAKLLALALAGVLWAGVTFLGSRTVTAEDIPVGVSNLREDLALANPLGPVRVRLRAPRSVLQGRNPADLVRAFVDLSGRGLGNQSADVTIVPTDARVHVLLVLPERLLLTLDPVVQRTLPVKAVTEGTPAPGYRVGAAVSTPATVHVRGALGRLQATAAIEAVVPVEGATAPFEGEVPLRVPEGLKLLLDHVQVTLDIVQAEETKTLGVRVVTTGSPAPGTWVRALTTDPSVVTVRGPRGALEARTFVDTTPLRLDGARGTLRQTLDLVLPAQVAVVGGEPRVQAQADIVPIEATKEVRAAVQVTQVPDGLRVAKVTPDTLRVTVQGSEETLNQLRDEQVTYGISASGRDAGTFTVRARREDARVPDGIRVASVEGLDIAVTLER
ncbi:MAG: hypothetical protein G01um1014106_556 [Parcubacteria group bacterium Gr01-1014_106]|nr:MAG: hypothetical protein G01um1014106_556 [Parcubacteria group bacterium Gr01-1014_106]